MHYAEIRFSLLTIQSLTKQECYKYLFLGKSRQGSIILQQSTHSKVRARQLPRDCVPDVWVLLPVGQTPQCFVIELKGLEREKKQLQRVFGKKGPVLVKVVICMLRRNRTWKIND